MLLFIKEKSIQLFKRCMLLMFLFTFFLWKSVYKSFGVFVRHEYHKSHEEQQACRNNDSDDIVNGIFSLFGDVGVEDKKEPV